MSLESSTRAFSLVRALLSAVKRVQTVPAGLQLPPSPSPLPCQSPSATCWRPTGLESPASHPLPCPRDCVAGAAQFLVRRARRKAKALPGTREVGFCWRGSMPGWWLLAASPASSTCGNSPRALAELLPKLDFSPSGHWARVLLHLPTPPEPWACAGQALASAHEVGTETALPEGWSQCRLLGHWEESGALNW